MKFKYRNLITFGICVFGLTLTGCKKFLDVNEDPNTTPYAQESLVLPSTQGAMGMIVGCNMQIFGGLWGQYWTQNTTNSQYKTIEQYQPVPLSFNRTWGLLYNTALQDIEDITRSKYDQYAAIAFIEKAYTYQLATDAFGDVPLKDALKGADNMAPHYDSQKEVYDSIIAWAQKGISLANNSAAIKPATDDLIFGGNMNSWKAFGNTLLLKIFMRLSEVDPAKAQAGIAKLYASSPTFLAANAKIGYSNTAGNYNPLFAETYSLNTQNLIASKTTIDALKANSDPRISYFYLIRGTTWNGNYQGDYGINQTNCAYPSTNVGGRLGGAYSALSATAPVILMSSAESLFLQAEAAARGWGSGDAPTLFGRGINESFANCGMSSSAAAYISAAPAAQFPADMEGQINAIITQKYFAMCGTQGFEAWTEWRRTGYPNILVVSRNSALGTTELPQRFLYPEVELTRNQNFPGIKAITQKVWWDVKQ